MDALTLDNFVDHLDAPFDAGLDGQASPFVLVGAQSLAGAQGCGQPPFSLLFRNPALLPQQIYRMHHPSLGLLEIFLVPVAREGDGYLYEALFN